MAEDFYIEGSDYIPEVKFEHEDECITISGKRSHNHHYVNEFFDPIFDWLEKYVQSKEVSIKVKLNFVDSKNLLPKLNQIEIKELEILEHLDTVPLAITEMKKLKKLDLSHNLLRIIPNEIADLQNLEELDLQNNQLKEIPEGLTQLKSLKKLNLKYNPLPKEVKDKIKISLPQAEISF